MNFLKLFAQINQQPVTDGSDFSFDNIKQLVNELTSVELETLRNDHAERGAWVAKFIELFNLRLVEYPTAIIYDNFLMVHTWGKLAHKLERPLIPYSLHNELFNTLGELWVNHENWDARKRTQINLITASCPHVKQGKFYYYPTVSSWLLKKPVQIKPSKYINWLGLANTQVGDTLLAIINKHLPTTNKKLNIQFYSSADYAGWEFGYTQNHNYASCMAGLNGDTLAKAPWACYASKAHGLPDNGLRLAVLLSDDGKNVARAITFKENNKDYYIRCYGDHNLKLELENRGYKPAHGLPVGTILATDTVGALGHAYACPYVDGQNVDAKVIEIDGIKALQITDDTDDDGVYIQLQSTTGYSYVIRCAICDEHIPANQESLSIPDLADTDGDLYDVCESCYYHDSRVVEYRGEHGTVFSAIAWGLAGDYGLFEHRGVYYNLAGLSYWDLVELHDGEICNIDDAFYCELSNMWYHENDGMHVTGLQAISLGIGEHGGFISYERLSAKRLSYSPSWLHLYTSTGLISDANATYCKITLTLADDTEHGFYVNRNHISVIDNKWLLDIEKIERDFGQEYDSESVQEINELIKKSVSYVRDFIAD